MLLWQQWHDVTCTMRMSAAPVVRQERSGYAVMDVTLVIDPFIEEYNDRTYLKCVTGEEAYDISFGPVLESQQEEFYSLISDQVVLESQQEQFYGLSPDQVVVGDVTELKPHYPSLESQQEQFYGLTSDQVVVGDVWPEGYRGAMYWFRQSAGGARIGAFFCDVTGRGGKERVTAAKMKPGAPIQPRVLTTTVSAGESVTLNMTSSSEPADRIEWRKDGDVLTGADALQFRLEDVRVEDSGIYETYYVTNQTVGGGRAMAEQAIMRLLVRACPVGLWGDECSMKCPTCFNGGVCHPRTGVCVCPPGFNGPICEKACGSNRYGKQCNLRCHLDFSGQTDPPDGCAHLTFCLPDPYGCSCAPGFTGLKCAEACSPGTFGAGCSLTCHCEGGVSCNRFTGVCPADCAPGYLGTNCQIECKAGTYGLHCDGRCNCHGGVTCNIVDGSCPQGCPEGYMGPDCQEQNGCLSHPCMYGGTCHPLGQDRYYCRCTDGYISRDCDPDEIRPPSRPDPCSGRPCWNGGVCVPDGTTFSCVCRRGFHGNVCQFVVPTPAPTGKCCYHHRNSYYGDVCQTVVLSPAPTDPPAAQPSFLLYRVLIPATVSVLVGIVFVTVLSCCSDKTDFKVENCVESGAAPPSEPPLVLQQKAMYMPPRNTQSERRWLSQIKKKKVNDLDQTAVTMVRRSNQGPVVFASAFKREEALSIARSCPRPPQAWSTLQTRILTRITAHASYPDLVLVNRFPYVQDDGTAEMYCVSNYPEADLNWNLLPTLGRDAQEMIDNQDRWLSGGPVPSTFAMSGRLFGINADAEGFRAGAWNCSDDGQGFGSWVIGITNFRSTAIKPFKVTQTVNEGQRGVNLIMNQTVPEAFAKRWNRGPNVIGGSDSLSLDLDSKRGGNTLEQFVSPGRGVLDCYQQGQREDPTKAGMMRVIVRSCPEGKFGGGCTDDCPRCYNGGMCHDETGECICPPGFMGRNCEEPCGGNKFGVNCTHQCKRPQRDDQCMELLFCMPDPWGCSCATGFRGDECDECTSMECAPGEFGSNCLLKCHCMNNETCDGATGHCPPGCAVGWLGPSCQEPDDCVTNECLNGATCNDLRDAYNCSCPIGWIGRFCETMTPEPCRDLEPCENGATCVPLSVRSNYTVTCLPTEPCRDLEPCENGATCVPLSEEEYRCDCVDNYTVTCLPSNYTVTCLPSNYTVTCLPSNYTVTCLPSNYTVTCLPSNYTVTCLPSNYTVTCLPSNYTVTCLPSNYTVTCLPSNYTVTCLPTEPCRDLEPCENGATCVPLSVRSNYTVTCLPTEPCRDLEPCENGATCVPLSEEEYRCDCAETYEGQHCEVQNLPGTYVKVVFSTSDLLYLPKTGRNLAETYEGQRCEVQNLPEEAGSPVGAIVGALVAVLLIGGIAGAAYYYLKVKKNKGNDGRVSPEAQGDSDDE
ncbi:hypothetical protein Bbelb_339210 [Branchiostoma belcheri]|nr:hypothetical protein Bbelb_339210 [Branchiostoma belcheri]